MNTPSPELNKNAHNPNSKETTIYDELAQIAKQQRADKLAEQQQNEEETDEASLEQVEATDPITAEIEADELIENQKYFADLINHMRTQQPEIYRDALEQIANERNSIDTEPTDSEELQVELDEKLSKLNDIPADLLEQMTTAMKDEEMRPNSTVWKEVNASGMNGDIARRWQDLYRKALQEVLR